MLPISLKKKQFHLMTSFRKQVTIILGGCMWTCTCVCVCFCLEKILHELYEKWKKKIKNGHTNMHYKSKMQLRKSQITTKLKYKERLKVPTIKKKSFYTLKSVFFFVLCSVELKVFFFFSSSRTFISRNMNVRPKCMNHLQKLIGSNLRSSVNQCDFSSVLLL